MSERVISQLMEGFISTEGEGTNAYKFGHEKDNYNNPEVFIGLFVNLQDINKFIIYGYSTIDVDLEEIAEKIIELDPNEVLSLDVNNNDYSGDPYFRSFIARTHKSSLMSLITVNVDEKNMNTNITLWNINELSPVKDLRLIQEGLRRELGY